MAWVAKWKKESGESIAKKQLDFLQVYGMRDIWAK
jgi:hypothetical protein